MYDVECILLRTEYVKDIIGQTVEVKVEIKVPILKVLPVYQKEFYEASIQGIRPTLKILLNNLNYNDEEELIYMDKRYTVIRTYNRTMDEIELTCEQKISDMETVD